MSLRDFFSLIQKVLTFVWLLIWMASFNQHTYNTDNKTGCKGNALSRLLSYIKFEKRPILMNFFFRSQLNQCLLVLVLCSHTVNNKINCLVELCIDIAYSDKTLSFEKLLEIGTYAPIHIRNLQFLLTEIFKETILIKLVFTGLPIVL